MNRSFVLFKVELKMPNLVTGLVGESLLQNSLQFDVTRGCFTEREIYKIYSHVPEPVLYTLQAKLVGRNLPLFMVWSHDKRVNVVKKIRSLRGLDNDPALCDRKSWRFQIADRNFLPYRRITLLNKKGKSVITTFDNFVHTPSVDDFKANEGIFSGFFK